MSRIGRKPISVPDGVKVTVQGRTVHVDGPKGKLAWEHRPEVSVALDDSGRTWREVFENQVREQGAEVPMVRCYYHLPEQYVEDPGAPGAKSPDPKATPTYNISADLELKEYPLRWQSDPRFSRPR